MNETPDTKRLFFALWPGNKLRKQLKVNLHNVKRNCEGRPLVPANLHMTLAFVGNVEVEKIPGLEAMASKVVMQPFSFVLDYSGHFRRPQVLWLGTQLPPPELIQLSDNLVQGCRDCGYKMEDRPFKPHVTLMRKVKENCPFDVMPVEWQAKEFVLVESRSTPGGVKYDVLKRWACDEG